MFTFGCGPIGQTKYEIVLFVEVPAGHGKIVVLLLGPLPILAVGPGCFLIFSICLEGNLGRVG